MTDDGEWIVVVSHRVRQVIGKLSTAERLRIERSIDLLRNGPESPAYKLKARPDWSIRVGGRRVLFRADRETKTIIVHHLGPRGDVYR